MLEPLKIHRLARRLWIRGVPKVPHLLTLLNLRLNGCEIPPSVVVGKGVRLHHNGLGVIFHNLVQLGDNVVVMSHVVVGQNYSLAGPASPNLITIESDVVLGTGAKVIASRELTIGRGAVIGANAVVTDDVAPGAVMAGVPARAVRASSDE